MTMTRAVLTQFVELEGKYFPPETLVAVLAESGDRVTISAGGRRGEVSREALAPPPPPPHDDPRAPEGKYRVLGKDTFSFEDPPYKLGDYDTLEEAHAAIRKAEEWHKDAGDLADRFVVYDEWGRVVR
jgi:hypothetical protein